MGELNRIVRAEPIPAGGDVQQVAYRVAEFVGVPLRVPGAGPVGVAHRHTLDIGLAQEAQHDALALCADSDERDVDLVAGRNIALAAEHVARDDREPQGRGSGLREVLGPSEAAARRSTRAVALVNTPASL